MFAAEVLSVAARRQDMPSFLARENANNVPSAALLVTSLLVQVILVAALFSDDAYIFAQSLCSHLSLIPYFLAAAFMLMLVVRKETYEEKPGELGRDRIIAVLATAYTIFLLFAGGIKFLLLGFIIYAPGSILYLITRRELGKQLFSPAEWVLFGVSVAGCLVGLHGLVTGYITI
jgi:arginine:ornithine antiporter/lysine permease